MSILVIAEHDNTELKSATLHAITAAKEIGVDIDILVAGSKANPAAEAASQIEGVGKVILAEAEHLEMPTAENVAAVVLAVLKEGGYSHVLATATSYAKSVLPRVAATLDVAQASDITVVESADTFVRPIYAGSALATVQLQDQVKVVSVRATAFDPAAATGGQASVETFDAVPPNNTRSKVVSREIAKLDRPALAGARVVISGGRGMAGEKNFKLLESIADKLGAAIGASRGAVDAGYAPSDYQVGQTGKVVAPDLYIAVGISGAIQHLAGMKDSKVIVAINKDPEAPIFQVADYGLVGDLFEHLPELERELG